MQLMLLTRVIFFVGIINTWVEVLRSEISSHETSQNVSDHFQPELIRTTLEMANTFHFSSQRSAIESMKIG